MISAMFVSCLLSACGGDSNSSYGGDSVGTCRAISGGGTQVSQSGTCTSCTSQNLNAAADGMTNTFATLTYPAGAAGTGAVRVTAQQGIVYPTGTAVFVVNATDYAGDSLNTSILLRTYLDGVLQEANNIGPHNTVGGPDEPVGKRGFNSSAPFDAAELYYERSGGSGTVELSVYEFCTN